MERASCYYQLFALIAFRSPIKSILPSEFCWAVCVCMRKNGYSGWKMLTIDSISGHFTLGLTFRFIKFIIIVSLWNWKIFFNANCITSSPWWAGENFASKLANTSEEISSIVSWWRLQPIAVGRVGLDAAKIDLRAKIKSISSMSSKRHQQTLWSLHLIYK